MACVQLAIAIPFQKMPAAVRAFYSGPCLIIIIMLVLLLLYLHPQPLVIIITIATTFHTISVIITITITSIYYQLLLIVHITQLILRKTMQPHINIQLIIQLLIILLLAISLTMQSSVMHFRVLVCFLMTGPVQLLILQYLKVPESVISMAMVFVMTIDDDCNSSVHDDNGSNIDDDHSNRYQMIMS